MEDSVRKELSLQNEVMRWMNELSEKVERRANQITLEVHELVEKTDSVEQDLKNARNSFLALSFHRYIENKVSEEDQMTGYTGADIEKPAEESIPAQSYETDILPRYKEAISLGLSSYRSHMQKTSRTPFPCSVFETGLACGPLPHIIGSEEYIHDNSCGLPEDLTLERISLDFRNVADSESICNDAIDFGSDMASSVDAFTEQPGPSKRDGTEPLVSAALDFKAMLEAALLSPYKFYDEESSSLTDTVHGHNNIMEQRHMELDHATSEALDIVEVTSQEPPGVSDATVLASPGNINSFLNSDVSALISGSLFDAEEDSPSLSSQEYHEILSSKSDIPGNADGKTLTVINDTYIMQDNLVEDDDASIVPQGGGYPEEISASTLISSKKGPNEVEASEPIFSCDGLVSYASEEESHLTLFQ